MSPADTFDNVKGQFPIGFYIWDTNKKEDFEHIEADVYDKNQTFIGTKNIWAYDKLLFIHCCPIKNNGIFIFLYL